MTGPAGPGRSSRLRGVLDDPVRLRRRAWLASLAVALVGGWAYGFGRSAGAALLLALTWVAMPFLAAGAGLGDAFFVRHGRGRRRVAATAALGVVLALTGCASLASIADGPRSTTRELARCGAYGAMFLALIAALAAVIALAVGRGEGYLARKIQAVDDEGW